MPDEYESLRAEVLQWQNRRFQLVGASITLVTGVLGLGLKELANGWSVISSLLLLVLTCAVFLSWYAGVTNTKIAMYLMVFHEQSGGPESQGSGWESRLYRLKNQQRKDPLALNDALVFIYFSLGVVSFFIPYAAAKDHSVMPGQLGLLILMTLAFLTALMVHWKYSDQRNRYLGYWRAVKRDELQGS